MSIATIATTAQPRAEVDVALLRSRAAELRAGAAEVNEILAVSYRRRAAELELEAAALAARHGLAEADAPAAA